MLEDKFYIRQLESSVRLIKCKEFGLYQLLSYYYSVDSSKIKSALSNSNTCAFSYSELSDETLNGIVIHMLSVDDIDVSSYPDFSPFIGEDWESNLRIFEDGIYFEEYIEKLTNYKTKITIPDDLNSVFRLDDEDLNFPRDVCRTVNEVATDLSIAVEDKKMILTAFYNRISKCVNQNKAFLKSSNTKRKPIVDSVKLMNQVYIQALDELPNTAIGYYVNIQVKVKAKKVNSNPAINTNSYFTLNKEFKPLYDTLCGSLKKEGYIESMTKEVSLKNIFSPDISSKITWVNKMNALHFFIQTLYDRKIILNNRDKFKIAREVFCKPNYEPFTLIVKKSDFPPIAIQTKINGIIERSFPKKAPSK